MSNRKTKYNKNWESEYDWLQCCTGDQFSANCKLCKKIFSISGGGVAQVKSHACSKIHLCRIKGRQEQSLFNKDRDNVIKLNQCRINFSHEEQVRKAEIIQALKSVKSNYSFVSASGDGERFKEMFPDSQITKEYKQNETKCKYTIQYGI